TASYGIISPGRLIVASSVRADTRAASTDGGFGAGAGEADGGAPPCRPQPVSAATPPATARRPRQRRFMNGLLPRSGFPDRRDRATGRLPRPFAARQRTPPAA